MMDLYIPLINLIINQFNIDYPLLTNSTFPNGGRNIFRGYQNNFTVPQNGKYVIITNIMPSESQTLHTEPINNVTNGTQEYITIVADTFQIDFYGANSYNNSRILQMLLNNSYANNFFNDHNYACSVYKTQPVKQLSDIYGRDMYLERYAVICSLFSNIRQTSELPTYDGVTNNIRLADIQ